MRKWDSYVDSLPLLLIAACLAAVMTLLVLAVRDLPLLLIATCLIAVMTLLVLAVRDLPLLLIAACLITVMTLLVLAVRDRGQWERFAAEHRCTEIGAADELGRIEWRCDKN